MAKIYKYGLIWETSEVPNLGNIEFLGMDAQGRFEFSGDIADEQYLSQLPKCIPSGSTITLSTAGNTKILQYKGIKQAWEAY